MLLAVSTEEAGVIAHKVLAYHYNRDLPPESQAGVGMLLAKAAKRIGPATSLPSLMDGLVLDIIRTRAKQVTWKAFKAQKEDETM